MANKSNWKGTEANAAKLFPGKAHRRTRVGGGTYALIADDVVWLFAEYEETVKRKNKKKPTKKHPHPKQWIVEPHIRKQPFFKAPPIYIECKKRIGSDRTTTFFRKTKEKYCDQPTDRLVLITQVKCSPQMLVTVEDEFFKELMQAWVEWKGFDVAVNDDPRRKSR